MTAVVTSAHQLQMLPAECLLFLQELSSCHVDDATAVVTKLMVLHREWTAAVVLCTDDCIDRDIDNCTAYHCCPRMTDDWIDMVIDIDDSTACHCYGRMTDDWVF